MKSPRLDDILNLVKLQNIIIVHSKGIIRIPVSVLSQKDIEKIYNLVDALLRALDKFSLS